MEERVLSAILARLDDRVDELVEDAARAIFTELPAYAAHANTALERGVHEHVRQHITATLASFREHGNVVPEDLVFIRRHAAQRVGQLSVADFIASFQVGQQVLWDAVLEMADDDASRRAVLALVGHITRYFQVATTHAAEVYLEAEQLVGAAGERLRRDTVEDLLAGRNIGPGAGQQALREAGLGSDTPILVIAAMPVEPDQLVEDIHALRGAGGTLARALRRAVPPLAVVRHDEIVIVAPAPRGELRAVAERLRAAQERLTDRGLHLAVGMSTVHTGLTEVPDAYAEALDARTLLAGRAGTVALPAMSAFDYLIRHGTRTARRLIPDGVSRFVAEDSERGGALLATLQAYAAADLNVKRAAEQLHVHVNTAHYRLARIEERTGADLRHVGDVIELLIAAQLAEDASPLRS